MQHILTEKTEKSFFTDQILPPLLHGENLTIVWPPHGGMKTQMKFLLKNAKFFGFSALGKHQFVYLNPSEMIDKNPSDYFSLILYCLDPKNYQGDENKSAFYRLKEKIQEFLKNDYQVIFVFIEFDKLGFTENFYNNLHALWLLDKSRIHFLFCVTSNIFEKKNLLKYGQIRETITQNIIYSPVLSREDIEIVIESLERRYNYVASLKTKKLIALSSGGHIGSAKELLRAANSKDVPTSNFLDFASQWYGLKIVFENLWESLNETDKNVLLQVANSRYSDHFCPSDYLLNLKLMIKNKNGYHLFSSLFEEFVKKQKTENQSLALDRQTGEILLNGCPVKEKITLHEYHILSFFLENPNVIVSRDKLSELLWGKDAFDKYSDWAIDKSISLLRKKLEQIGVSSDKLQTIKGRGYRWLP